MEKTLNFAITHITPQIKKNKSYNPLLSDKKKKNTLTNLSIV